MNPEDMRVAAATEAVHAIEERAAARGGHIVETDAAGTIPDELLRAAAGGRLRSSGVVEERLPSSRVPGHLAERSDNSSCD